METNVLKDHNFLWISTKMDEHLPEKSMDLWGLSETTVKIKSQFASQQMFK